MARELGISMELIKIIFNFVKFIATKKCRATNSFPPPLFCCCWIRDPGSGMEEKMRIRVKHPNTGMSVRFPFASSELGLQVAQVVACELGISMELIKIILNIVNFIATKKGRTNKIFPTTSFLLLLDPRSGSRDPGWKKIRIRGINIPVPQNGPKRPVRRFSFCKHWACFQVAQVVAHELGISMELIKIIFNFVKSTATKKVRTKIFSPHLFFAVFWIRDPGSGIRDGRKLGSGINTLVPQHWLRRHVRYRRGMYFL